MGLEWNSDFLKMITAQALMVTVLQWPNSTDIAAKKLER